MQRNLAGRVAKDLEAARQKKLDALKAAEEKLKRFDDRTKTAEKAKVKAKSLAMGEPILIEMAESKDFRGIVMEALKRRMTNPYYRKLFGLPDMPKAAEEPPQPVEKHIGGGGSVLGLDRVGKKAQTA